MLNSNSFFELLMGFLFYSSASWINSTLSTCFPTRITLLASKSIGINLYLVIPHIPWMTLFSLCLVSIVHYLWLFLTNLRLVWLSRGTSVKLFWKLMNDLTLWQKMSWELFKAKCFDSISWILALSEWRPLVWSTFQISTLRWILLILLYVAFVLVMADSHFFRIIFSFQKDKLKIIDPEIEVNLREFNEASSL